jgi:hypothetical protein
VQRCTSPHPSEADIGKIPQTQAGDSNARQMVERSLYSQRDVEAAKPARSNCRTQIK